VRIHSSLTQRPQPRRARRSTRPSPRSTARSSSPGRRGALASRRRSPSFARLCKFLFLFSFRFVLFVWALSYGFIFKRCRLWSMGTWRHLIGLFPSGFLLV